MSVFIYVLCFAGIFLLLYALLIAPRQQQEAAVKERVQSLRKDTDNKQLFNEFDKSLTERLLHPLASWLQNFIKGYIPQRIYNNILRQAALVADRLRGGIDGFFILWFVSICSLPLFAAYKLFIAAPINPLRALVAVFFAFILGVLLPIFYLRYLLSQRRQALLASLPEILDLLAVSVQAGLGLDGAIQKVVEKMNNPLSRELQHMLRELHMGITRRQALQRLAERCELAEIAMFASAVIQSDKMGMGIARIIEVQAENMRYKKMQIIREKAAQMPLKLLFPLIMFIFPTVFIVVLGPRLISLLNIMNK